MRNKTQYIVLAAFLTYIALSAFRTSDSQPAVINAETHAYTCETHNIVEAVAAVETEPAQELKHVHISLGTFTLTAYCSCSECCGVWAINRPVDEAGNEIVIGAAGEVLKPEYSIAVDPSVIPYGTLVYINGVTYKAQDTGGSITGNRIDVYFNNHAEALKFGVKTAEVYIEEV